MNRWEKRGRIWTPDGSLWWARDYALLPTPRVMGDVLRVYIASLDEKRHGRVGYVDVAADDPLKVLYVSPEPVLDIGEPGTFDDSGVNPSCLIQVGSELRMYYIGWQRSERVPYLLFAGMAVSREGSDAFERIAPVPVLERTVDEPYLRSATTVIATETGFEAWYVGAVGWTTVEHRPVPQYVIRSAESTDGVSWHARVETCIGPKSDDEYGFGRPWVLRENDRYRMWYSIRSRTSPYRLGYAESADGRAWSRMDEQAGVMRAADGWDSQMVCYPAVTDVHGRRYLFYNGNRHGQSGFGFAELV